MLALCETLFAKHVDAPDMLSEVGRLLLHFGYLTFAGRCFSRVLSLRPDDPAAWMNLANIATEAGDQATSRRAYADALARWPNLASLQRNFLNCLAYDPELADEQSRQLACDWGAKALQRTRGILPRPPLCPPDGRPLRVGYVSADFCNHTVGHFLRDVLKAHDRQRIEAFAYAHVKQDDWITREIRASTNFVDVTALDDQALAARIRADAIDVLVDLSGHTAGSRLLSFVFRPAPVMVSWLGYYATTGLPVIDAVLLDEWHAPAGTGRQFVEPIVHLPRGRFCFSPHDWMPAPVPLPSARKGYITFGCFNNTAKLNPAVFDTWARVLHEVPNSRLLLKWRTFQDDELCRRVTGEFVSRGIDASRIELRGASFHKLMLEEYGDVDIALDPFPFTGGLTSCEALWMGVPVVTWPQSRVVSRQTAAFLQAIGLPEWIAGDADDYVRIAREMAVDRKTLAATRQGLRQRMRESMLCDVEGFTRSLEDTLGALYAKIFRESVLKEEAGMVGEQNVVIDGVSYPLASLSETAKGSLQMLQQTDQELQRLQVQTAIAQTARLAYANALKDSLPKS